MSVWKSIGDGVAEEFTAFKSWPQLRQAWRSVGAAGASLPKRFEPELSYATIRVVELRLAEARRYATEFLPMCTCFLRKERATRRAPCRW